MLLSILAASALAAEPYELRNTNGWFLAGELGGSIVVGFMGPDLILGSDRPEVTCANGWCETNGFDAGLMRILKAPNPKPAGAVSHVFTIGLTPAVAFGGLIVPAILADKPGYAAQDSTIVLSAFAISTGFNSVAKVAGRRQRPAFHYDREGQTEAAGHPREEFLSFYSGDTTWAFTLASSASTLAFLRGYEHAEWLALGTGTLALTGSVLRCVADMHWPTDVLMGAATGTAIGIGMPLALHGRKSDQVAIVPMGGRGMAVVVAW